MEIQKYNSVTLKVTEEELQMLNDLNFEAYEDGDMIWDNIALPDSERYKEMQQDLIQCDYIQIILKD